jgi:hypothetical protein
MECPRCRLENPPTAERCDCGYGFVVDSDNARRSTAAASDAGATPGSNGTAEFLLRLLLASVVVGLPLIGIAVGRSGRSALAGDETLTGDLVLVAVLAVTSLLAIASILVAAVSRSRRAVVLGAIGSTVAIVPVCFLMAATSYYLGWPIRGEGVMPWIILLLNGLWIAAGLGTWRWLERRL